MTETASDPTVVAPRFSTHTILTGLLMLAILGIVIAIASTFARFDADDELLLDSTVGELAIWMSEQTGEEEIDSYLGQFAENIAESRGEETLDPEVLLDGFQTGLLIWAVVIAVSAAAGTGSIFWRPQQTRNLLLVTLIGMDSLLFVVPVIEGDSTQTLILLGIFLLLIVMLSAPGKVTRVLGFFVVLSALFVAWETSKGLAESVNYQIKLPQDSWEYTTYESMDNALTALAEGEIDAVILDRRDLQELMAPYPDDPDEAIDPQSLPYPTLRYLENLDPSAGFAIFSISPEFPGRLKVAVREQDVTTWSSISDIEQVQVATVAGEFAEERYLAETRSLILADLKILNNINLPHLQTIAEAFMQPARRNGSQLLIRILWAAARYTWYEAIFGFAIGAVLGFILGTVFAHSNLMERSLLPYVVASQTVPILALAPMVVIWLGASQTSVAVIAAYLTFFPVTINTLRGLQSPSLTQVQLMESYAASRWMILWKLRVPAALPYIFTALKVSATASVVGAIIGELPSGIGEGLGRAILDFSSDYSLVSTPKLWASIIMAASVGIFFFVAVNLAEMALANSRVKAQFRNILAIFQKWTTAGK